MTGDDDIIGIVPAAGRGSRLGALPFSKELLPLNNAAIAGGDRLCLAIDNTLDTFAEAGIERACIVIASHKGDIVSHVRSGDRNAMQVAYVVADDSPSVPASLDRARFITRDHDVALLFPDIVFEPRDALGVLIEHRRQPNADLTLALVPAPRADKIDLVTVSDNGAVEKVTPKPGRSHSGWTWVAAIWNPAFSLFLHEFVSAASKSATPGRELYVADIINAAIDSGYGVTSVAFDNGWSFDLGTREELAEYRKSGLF